MSQQVFGTFDDATVGAAARLSVAAWPQSLGKDSLQSYLKNNGWNLTNLPGFVPANDGYYGANSVHAFVATKGDTLAISIRGIEDDSDIVGAYSAARAPLDSYRDILP